MGKEGKKGNVFKTVGIVLLIIVLSPIILVGLAVWFVIAFIWFLFSPIERGKYKKSEYYRLSGEKYRMGITSTVWYIVVNYAVKQGKHAVYSPNFVGKFFLYDDDNVYLFTDGEEVLFDAEQGEWMIPYEETTLPLSEYVLRYTMHVDMYLQRYNNVKLLLLDVLVPNDLERAKTEKYFVVADSPLQLAKKIC